MTTRYRCPWCATVERGARASALMRKHVLERHRLLLIRGLGIIESFGTRKTPDPPRNAANGPLRRTWEVLREEVSGEGDT